MDPISIARSSFVAMSAGLLAFVPSRARATMHDPSLGDSSKRLIARGEFARITIVHLPSSISTRASLTLADLESSPDARRLTIDDPAAVDRIVAAAHTIVGMADASARYDCRWSFRFERGHELSTLTSDGFGRVGTVDGEDVEFAKTAVAFLIMVANEFPALR